MGRIRGQHRPKVGRRATSRPRWQAVVQPTRTVFVVVDDTEAARGRLRELLSRAGERRYQRAESAGDGSGGERPGDDSVLVDRPLLARLLAERPIQQAQDEAMRTVTRTVGHELSQPLALLMGLLELRAAGALERGDRATLWGDLEVAATDLAARLERL